MLFRSLKKSPNLVLKSVSTAARFSEQSESLAAKYEAQVAWMDEKGIVGSLSEADRLPPRRTPNATREDSDK